MPLTLHHSVVGSRTFLSHQMDHSGSKRVVFGGDEVVKPLLAQTCGVVVVDLIWTGTLMSIVHCVLWPNEESPVEVAVDGHSAVL